MSFVNFLLRTAFGFVLGVVPILIVLSLIGAAVSTVPFVVVLWPMTLSAIGLYVLLAWLRWHRRRRREEAQRKQAEAGE
ncbi:hypothetical protein C882_3157 [Caenispirillum salinarum AK4]|uniref:Uncharacterized protein n=1 Tax=Caenispirillum salinarum AK4 TaxID=1238182 RepID=K9HP88_9PROT|nr:hypothetical protein [Caenispirillum salinarum]EKV32093.1 hypothetical protein C882_3157 [Caenispirillum salinarum AK4]